jgi:hypothetical protein
MAILTELSQLGPNLQWHLYITCESPEKMVVSVCPVNNGITQKQNAQLRGLNITGSPQHLDEKLVQLLREHTPKAVEFFTNCKSYNDELEIREKELKEKRATAQQTHTTNPAKSKTAVASVNTAKAKEPPKKDPQTQKFEAAMKVVEQLEADKKYGQAIAKLPTLQEYPQFKEQIEYAHKRLRNKHSGYNMFDIPETPPAMPGSTEELTLDFQGTDQQAVTQPTTEEAVTA